MNPASRRWVGRVLRDRWRIDARISRGGVGTVYAATHKNNGSRAAIKVLHPEFSRDADTRGRFLQEGYAANHVNHPGVVRILDDDTSEDGHAYLVMELLEGELLETRRVRKGGRLPLSDVFEVGEQLLDVLAAAHDKGIVHRDIKPDNLFITKEGRLKVLDFGFAQMKSSFRTEQTATGFLLGTPGYMSPEQAVGNRPQIDAQTDIWAVGATLFMLASGEAVHAGESAAEMLVAAANFSPRSLATVTSGLNPRFVKVVDKAVAFDKKSRWQSARAMQSALREAAGQQLSGQVSRRSIPDGIPSVYEDVSGEEATEIALMTEVEELDASELESWGSSARERTVVAQTQVTDAALPSAITRPAPAAGRPSAEPERHPADDDGPTLGIASPGPGMVDPHADGGTLIMESPAALRDDPARSSRHRQPSSAELDAYAYAHAPPLSQPQVVAPHVVPYGQPPLERQPSFAVDPRAIVQGGNAGASGAHYALPPASAAHTLPAKAQRGGGSRALMLIAVAVCTMIVVILAGLAVMSITD